MLKIMASVSLLLLSQLSHADYSNHSEAKKFIQKMVIEHQFDATKLTVLFMAVEKRQSILDAMARPAEKTKTWAEYRDIFLKDRRIEGGVQFWRDNKAALQRAEEQFGVPAEYIVSIIGVETLYGHNTGSYRVMDAIATLAFDYPRRSRFFTKELEHYLLLTRDQGKDPLEYKGSYAGAMGYGQFMPSSYRNYAIDFNNDDFPDIWNSKEDAIGSVANYFKGHGWRTGKHVIVRARPSKQFKLDEEAKLTKPTVLVSHWQAQGLTPVESIPSSAAALALGFDGKHGIEYWLGLNNFYTITRYNHSPMYALAVHQLAGEIYGLYQREESAVAQ